MATRRFTKLTAGALSVTSDGVTIESGKSLILGAAGTNLNAAVNREQLNAVEAKVDGILQDSDNAANTLKELQTLAEEVRTSGVTNLTNAVATLSNDIFKLVNVQLNRAVAPDEAEPKPMPLTVRNATSVDGWYFKNNGPSSKNRKINWYMAAPSNNNGVATIASLSEINMSVFLQNKTSPPFVTVYTKPKASGNYAAWYHSKRTYIVWDNASLNGTDKHFLFRALVSGSAAAGTQPGFKTIDLTIDPINTLGAGFSDDDEIWGISFGTDSSAAAGNVELVLSSVKMFSTNDNVNYVFSNSGPLMKYMMFMIDELYTNAFGEATSPSANIPNLAGYYYDASGTLLIN